MQPGKPIPLSLKNLLQELQDWDQQLDLFELECLLSGLIYKKFVRGYLMQEKSEMVVAGTDAFPQIN